MTTEHGRTAFTRRWTDGHYLTAFEVGCLLLHTGGMSWREVGRTVGFSEEHLKGHMVRVRRRWGVRSTAAVVHAAYMAGLLA